MIKPFERAQHLFFSQGLVSSLRIADRIFWDCPTSTSSFSPEALLIDRICGARAFPTTPFQMENLSHFASKEQRRGSVA